MPFLDLGRIHAGLKRAILDDIARIIDSGVFADGPAVEEFESDFASYCGVAHCVGTASGLDSLRIALLVSDLGPGDEVIVPAMTFVATAEAVAQVGARPVVVDVSPQDYNIDTGCVRRALTPRTRAVLAVDLYGQMADMVALRRVADDHALVLIEDACQAHGAERADVRPGTLSDAAAFSFYPGKNLGAMGDAGALVAQDDELARRARALRQHGQPRKYAHEEIGYTARLDAIQAAVLRRKLVELDRWNAERRRAAALYSTGLAGVGDVALPPVPATSEPVWHLYALRTSVRAELEEHLGRRRIGTGRHYPVPVHLTGAFSHLGQPCGSCPVAEGLAEELLSLPIFPGITDEELETVVAAIADFYGSR